MEAQYALPMAGILGLVGLVLGWLISPVATSLVSGPDDPISWRDLQRTLASVPRRPHLPTIVMTTIAAFALPATYLAANPIPWQLWPGCLVTIAGCAALVSIDFRYLRLPDVVIISTSVSAAILFLIPALIYRTWSTILTVVITCITSLIFYLVLALVDPTKSMGFGDVKLAPLLALVTAPSSWVTSAFAVFAAFLLGALSGIVLLLFRRIGRTTPIPFGPWMIAGAALALAGHAIGVIP